MVETVRDALVNALEDLCEQDLRKFCNKIRDIPIKNGFNQIPRSKLEKKDAEEVVAVIRDFYQDQYGAQLTVAVLNAISQRNVASKLERNLARVMAFGYQQEETQEEEPPSEAAPRQLHFVDEHREGLIQGVMLIAPVLDSLLSENLLTYEDYDTILAEKIPQKQMRKLFASTRGWGESDKDKLYNALKTHNAPLIKNLEQI